MSSPTVGGGPLHAPPTLRERVEDRLLAAITSGVMHPGVLYSAPALAADFGVSATPVREAMVNLARRGIVAVEQRRGFRVVEVTRDKLDEITMMRTFLEGGAMERLAGTIPPADEALLRAEAEKIVTAGRDGDIDGYLIADRRFHLRLVDYLGNASLTAAIADLRLTTRLFGLRRVVGSIPFLASNAEHHELLDLLFVGDGPGARELMERHVGHVQGWGTSDADL